MSSILMSEQRANAHAPAESSPRNKRMLGSTVTLSASRVYSALVTGLQGIYVARQLGPELFGLFNLIYLVGWYVGFLQFGAREVLYREIPFFRGQGDAHRESLVRDVGITADLLARAIGSLALVVGSWWLSDPTLRIGLMVWAVTLFGTRVAELYSVLSTVERDFVLVSWVNALRVTVTLLVVVASIGAIGIYAPLTAPLIGAAFAILFYRRRHPLAFSITFNGAEVVRIARFGIPLALLTLLSWVYQNVDRTVVAVFLDKTQLGYYGAAAFVTLFLIQVPGDFITVLQPELYKELGKANHLVNIRHLVVATTRVCAYLSPLGVLLLWVWLPPTIRWLLPGYGPSIAPLLILSLNLFFASALAVPYTMLYSPGIDRQKHCLAIWAGAAVLTSVIAYLALSSGYGLVGVAVASVIGQAVAAVAFFVFAHPYFSKWLGQDGWFYAEICLPFLYAGACLWLLSTFWPELWTHTVAGLIGQSVALAVLYAPWLYLLAHKTGLSTGFGRWFKFAGTT